MNKKILGVGIGITAIIVIIIGISFSGFEPNFEKPTISHDKIGLVINTPEQSTSLQELNRIYDEATSSGIGRSNVYLFWNIIEPEKGQFNWEQSDILMSFNKKNALNVTLYFSLINGKTLGPFPNWIGKPPLQSVQNDKLINVLDSVLSRYDIIDTVIIAGETEEYFRYSEQNIPVYKDLFNSVYSELKKKHPDIKFGNAFSLHGVINKNLEHIVNELAIGDFVAFSYFPVDPLNEIVKTPDEAKQDLIKTLELAPNKKIGFFEISWSTSNFVGGSTDSQKMFIEKSFEFYSENESDLEFFTWYRQYDKHEGTCVIEEQEIGEESVSIGGGSSLGSSEFVIERLSNYMCDAGLINVNGNPKSGWNEFKNQIESIN